MAQKNLVVVVGPTGIGKTSLAIALAKHYKTEILSADSRQFYKEMTIGTAVPAREELIAAPHHFIQHKSIHDDYSVGDFERDAIEKIDQLFQKHDLLVLVGGSGLYIDAVVKGLDVFPQVDQDIRKTLNSELTQKGIEALQNELSKADPDYAKKVDLQNPHRVIRALEIFRATGKPYSSFLGQKKSDRAFKPIFLGINAERATVYERINKRVDQMMANGLLKEANSLYPYASLNALQTVGYKELFQYFEQGGDLENAVEEIKKNTRRFAKRQGTWFRKNEAIHWITPQTPIKEVTAYIQEKLGS